MIFFRNRNYFSSENSIDNLFHYGSKINGKDSQTEFLLLIFKTLKHYYFKTDMFTYKMDFKNIKSMTRKELLWRYLR